MRHTVHIMLGDNAGRVLTDIKKYIIKYGSDEENSFFNAMLYREGDDGAKLCTALPLGVDESKFVSGIENLYNISLEDYCTCRDVSLRYTIRKSPSTTPVTLLLCTYVSTFRFMKISIGRRFLSSLLLWTLSLSNIKLTCSFCRQI